MKDLGRSDALIRQTGTSDPDEFQMPLHGLYADLELGRGSVSLAEEFQRSPSLVKLQLLRDWQRSLNSYRQSVMRQFAQELTGGAPSLPPSERLALVRSTCETLRIELPTGFDALATEL